MTTIIDLPHCRICDCDVPEDTKVFATFGNMICYKLNENQKFWETTNLPPGSWSILGEWPNGITEEQAGQVVGTWDGFDHDGKEWSCYKDYEFVPSNEAIGGACANPNTALESLRTLLTAHGIQVEGKKHLLLIDKK